MYKICIALLCVTAAVQAQAQNTLPVIPVPVKAQVRTGQFIITEQTLIVDRNGREQATIDFFNNYLEKYYGFRLQTAKKPRKNSIVLSTRTFIKAPDNAERYTLTVTPAFINITGGRIQYHLAINNSLTKKIKQTFDLLWAESIPLRPQLHDCSTKKDCCINST